MMNSALQIFYLILLLYGQVQAQSEYHCLAVYSSDWLCSCFMCEKTKWHQQYNEAKLFFLLNVC